MSEKSGGRLKFWGGILAYGCLAIVCLFALYQGYARIAGTGLPDDEEIIANFRAHQDDFEELMRQYRTQPGGTLFAWSQRADVQETMKRAGISNISETVYRWYPDPYSVQTAKKKHAVAANKDDPVYGLDVWHKYSEARIKQMPFDRYTKSRLIYAKNGVRMSMVWKEFVHMPEAPRVENGWLLNPPGVVSPKIFSDAQYYEKENVYIRQTRRRVLPTLNKRPENWEVYECVYRQLEPQWFLRMCNGR